MLTLDHAATTAKRAGDLREQAEFLLYKARVAWKRERRIEAIDYARTAIRTADRSADTTQQRRSRQGFFQIAAATPAPGLLEHLMAALTLPAGDPR